MSKYSSCKTGQTLFQPRSRLALERGEHGAGMGERRTPFRAFMSQLHGKTPVGGQYRECFGLSGQI